jgi:ABC-2 type transport system permease protein
MTLDAPTAVRPEGHLARPDVELPLERVNSPTSFWRGFIPTVRQIAAYHELLNLLVRKELKVKYKGSVMGFLWTLIRPLMMLLIYAVAFGTFLNNHTPDFVVFLFCGLAPWTFYSDVAVGATQSIVSNSGLIKKVYFPREILPLAVIGASLFQFVIQLFVLFCAVVVSGRAVTPGPLLILIPTTVGLVIFATGMALLLSASNVYLRDTQHLVEIMLQAWFFLTPIIYNISMVLPRLNDVSPLLTQLFLANPMADVAMGYQRALFQRGTELEGGKLASVVYTGNIWAREGLFIVCALVLLWVAQRIFARAQGNFAQEL